MRVQDLIDAMERIAPLEYAESWDRVGLHVGRRDARLDGPILLTIDLTERVLAEARAKGCKAIVAYHATIWEPIRSITGDSSKGRILLGAAEAGIAVYTPHTALDAVPGGVADWLCEGLSGSTTAGKIAGDCRALQPAQIERAPRVKIVTFVPVDAVEQVRNALATAGAGTIGNYQLCSFEIEGHGTFMGGEGSSPVVGEAGRLERVPEVRLEMVCPRDNLALAIETMRSFHPYEEPALDIVPIEAPPLRRVGVGRRLTLDQPVTIAELAERTKKHLGRARIRAAVIDPAAKITSIGVVPGAGESLLHVARREGCELFMTGEMKHHDVMEALHAGIGVLLAGHTNTERGYLARLSGRLSGLLDGHEVLLSEADVDVLQVM